MNDYKNVCNCSCDTFKGNHLHFFLKHTHNAFLWCRGDYVANVHVFRSQFAMQTQEITESPFHRKLISAEKFQGCLKEGKKQYVSVQAHFHKNCSTTGVPKPLALN